MSPRSGTVLLRQVVYAHGSCVPPLRSNDGRRWLDLLPSGDVARALDRHCVVLPRGGDGSYAPPPSERSVPFPGGELTGYGVESLRAAGRALYSPSGGSSWSEPIQWIRTPNRPAMIASAKALAWGAVEAVRSNASFASPVEVLLQEGEDLLPTCKPGDAGFPLLPAVLAEVLAEAEGTAKKQVDKLLLAAGLDTRGNNNYDVASIGFSLACASELAGAGSQLENMYQHVHEINSLSCLRWAAPLVAHPESVGDVVGPWLRIFFEACDEALEDSAGSNWRPSLQAYVTTADMLTCLLAAFNLVGLPKVGVSAQAWKHVDWPQFGASLEVTLSKNDGKTFLHFSRNGKSISQHACQDSIPYEQLREHLGALCAID